jgi:hypothetical protein
MIAGDATQLRKVVAFEDGRNFDSGWTKNAGSGVWGEPTLGNYAHHALHWKNNTGVAIGSALFRLPYTDFSLETDASFEDGHTVHVTLSKGNGTADGPAIGPATVLAGTNGYGVTFGTGTIKIVKITGLVLATVASTSKTVYPGQVVSLSWRWDLTLLVGDLAVLVDGVSVLTGTDVTYRMSTVSGKFGLVGDLVPSIPNAAGVGSVLYQWWVTDGYLTYHLPKSTSERRAALRLTILQRQRFTDDPTPAIHRLISGELTRCKWSHKRIGGCASLSASFRYPRVESTGDEHVDAKIFDDPSGTDWNTTDWLGGEVILDALVQDDTRDPVGSDDSVWRGRVSKISWDPSSEEITLQARGLVTELDNLFVEKVYENISIRAVVRDLIETFVLKRAKSQRTVKLPSGALRSSADTYIRGVNIVGSSSTLDLKVSFDFQHESIMSAIGKLFEFFPAGAIWGVDRTGTFFLDQQLDHYSADMLSGDLQHFTVDNEAVRFVKTMDFDEIENDILVLGKKIENEPDTGKPLARARGRAVCERSRELFGLRQVVQQDNSIQDSGLAAKIAAAQLKKLLVPRISGRLTVELPLRGNREFNAALQNAAPRVAVDDRRNNELPDNPFGLPFRTTEYMLRLYGDLPAYTNAGAAKVTIISTAAEQALNKSWLLHVVLKFTDPHPGANLQFAWIVGRPGSGATDDGWGGLYWNRITATVGRLDWLYTNSVGLQIAYNLGIAVHPTTPANQVVHLTLIRDKLGDWRAYDGNTAKNVDATRRADILKTSTAGWFFREQQNTTRGANYQFDWIGSFEELWLVKTVEHEKSATGLTEFIAANNNLRMRRNRAEGLLMYYPANDGTGFMAPIAQPVWKSQVGSSPGPDKVSATWFQLNLKIAAVTNGARRGHFLGDEKKWGGALVYNSEQVDYEINPRTGHLTRTFRLGPVPVDIFTTVAQIEDEIRRFAEERRRDEE